MSFLSSAMLLTMLATVTSVPAPGLAVSDITVNHGHINQTKKLGDDAVAFFSVHNDGGAADKLTAWSCGVAALTVLVGADGKPLPDLTIAPHQTINMAANGIHLVLQNNHYLILLGSIVPCAMTFQNEGPVQLLLYSIDTRKNP